jgi:ribosome-binding protein aMBF1 (putative translation factor)
MQTSCHHVEVSTQMPLAVEAQRAYKQADEDALKMRFRARAQLGKTVFEERTAKGLTQGQAAAELGVVVEQVRRYERSFRQWQRQYPGEPLG